MRVLAVCESPPTLDPRHANGSTLISHHVLQRLPPADELELVWFRDRAAEPSADVAGRCDHVSALDLVSLPLAVASRSHLPLATARRSSRAARDLVRRRAAAADVVYLHGLHTFGLAFDLPAPVVVHEIDPWSHFWSERATRRSGLRARYDRGQAARAARLEGRVAEVAAAYLVVNASDAQGLERTVGRPVLAVPNGVDAPVHPPGACDQSARDEHRCIFAGTLDYAPNVDAATRLAREVWPRVVAAVPGARLTIAGRRPTAEIQGLAGPGVEVLADVEDLHAELRNAAVAIFAGDLGRGTKNSVAEAMAAGCAIVATPASARGLDPWPELRTADGPEGLARAVIDLLSHPDQRTAAGEAARRAAQALPTWDGTAARYVEVLRRAASR